MLNDNVKAWVAALRSGDYEQGTGQLYDGLGYCCLGVGCHVADKMGANLQRWEENGMLNADGKNWLGLQTSFGDFDNDNLADLNDNGSTFAEIADIIESEPLGLFAEVAHVEKA